MTDTNKDDQNHDDNAPLVEMPEGGSVAERIQALEHMENGLVAKLYNAGDKEEQELIGKKLDYVAVLIDRMSKTQAAVEQAGKTVTQHAEGGYTPHDKIRALDILMNEASATGDMNSYKMYREQRRELASKYGTPGKTTSTSARNPNTDELKKIVNSYASEHCGADLATRMEAAANAGDMKTYKELRAQRQQERQQA